MGKWEGPVSGNAQRATRNTQYATRTMPTLYERSPEYWTRDLADRTFETAVMARLGEIGWEFQDNTASHDRPDLYIFRQARGERVRLALELKEKRQHYRERWAELAGVPETNLLVVDEVALRKLVAWAPRAHLLFWDETRPDRPYVLFSIIDLLCVPKVRVQRPITLNSPLLKAKWLLDRRHGRDVADLDSVLAALDRYVTQQMWDDMRRLKAHGDFIGETVETL
jgi:hypothetical protein